MSLDIYLSIRDSLFFSLSFGRCMYRRWCAGWCVMIRFKVSNFPICLKQRVSCTAHTASPSSGPALAGGAFQVRRCQEP